MKGLFDFSDVNVTRAGDKLEPTHVVAEVSDPGEKTSRVYLASELGFQKTCEGCAELLMVQDVDSMMLPLRVFCRVDKCVR